MAGDAGARLTLPPTAAALPAAARRMLFTEELGLVLEVRRSDLGAVAGLLGELSVPHTVVGASTRRRELVVEAGGEVLLREETSVLRAEWEAASLRLEKLQANPACIEAEERYVRACVCTCMLVRMMPRRM